MVPTTPLETKRHPQKGPAVYAILICLDGCKTAYLGVAIGRGLVLNWERSWQNCMRHITHSVVSLYIKSNPSKSVMDRGVLTRNKTDIAFCPRGSFAQMRNQLGKSPTKACRS